MRAWLNRTRIKLTARFFRWLIRNDGVWRVARRCKPVLALPPRMNWVSRHDDVADVLSRDRDFAVPYLPNLDGLRSPFLLGLPDGEDYAGQLVVLSNALRNGGWEALEKLSISAAKRALAQANGTIDVVGDLTEKVLLDTVGAYLGTGQATPGQLEQSQAIFYEVFINGLRNPVVTEEAQVAGAALRAHFAALFADRRAAMQRGEALPDDVLDRLLRAVNGGELTLDEAINSLLGLFVGWTTPVSRSMGFGIDALLEHPEAVALGREAALAGDHAAVRRIMREALRFQPSAPALERICARATYIGGRRIERGEKVMALVNSAMMDGRRVRDPRRFDPDRGEEANLHFGSQRGKQMHRCIGEHISMVQIGAIASALLAHGEIEREHKLKLTGPYPSQLLVRLRPGGSP